MKFCLYLYIIHVAISDIHSYENLIESFLLYVMYSQVTT